MIDFDKSLFDLKVLNLKDFPHTTFNNRVEGKNGIIDFFNVPTNTKVLTLDEKSNLLKWTNVKFWSVHRHRKLEIITLANGLQIFTDNDPRATYGIRKSNLKDGIFEYERNTPSDAKSKDVFIPVHSLRVIKRLGEDDIEWNRINENIKNLDDALFIVKELFANGVIASIFSEKNKYVVKPFQYKVTKEDYIKVSNDLTFYRILDIQYTDKYEDGYDLTVADGSQTFLSHNGIVLSNTINIHIPSLPEAQDDLRKKLLPSRQIYGIRNVPKKSESGEPQSQEEVVNKLKQDLILGLYGPNKRKSKHKWLFATEQDALKAIKSGKVGLSDEVEILEK